MALRIKGFDKQNIISQQTIIEAVKALPEAHIKNLRFIVYDPGRFYQRSYVQPVIPNRHIKGEYYPQMLDAVILYEIQNQRTFEHILYHEVGHFVFQRILSSEVRKDWVTRMYPKPGYVSDYAQTNAQEDFAESYAFYMQDSNFGYSVKHKFHFLKRHVFLHE